jgi:hypothetical protein
MPAVPIVKAETATLAASPDSYLWNFRAHILDRLDEYFACARRLRKHDPDSYALYSRIGLSIPKDLLMEGSNFAAYPKVTFGGVLFGTAGSEIEVSVKGTVNPSFLYFQKMTAPSGVEWTKGDVYSVTAIYDDRHRSQAWRSRLSAPLTFHVAVTPDGEARLLKELICFSSAIIPMRTKRGRKHKAQAIAFSSRRWDYPKHLKQIAADHDEDVSAWALRLFKFAFFTSAECQSSIIVRAKKDGVTAAFGIDAPRAKVFFKDRDSTALAADGKRKRIFHSVRAHHRVTLVHKNEVKAHYRGLRHFGWNGYGIAIVFPDNNRLLRFTGAARYLQDTDDTRPTLSMKEAGKIIDRALTA